MVGRFKPGISPAQAQSDAQRVAQEIMRNFPADIASLRISSVVRSLQEETVEQSRPLLRTLFLAVAVVLLIACANLAGLMLVRAIRKQREIAVRLALGANTAALLRQTLLESLVLSVSGGLLGLALAGLALGIGKSLLPESLPRISEIALNWQVVGVCPAACGHYGTGLRHSSSVCRSAHQRQRHLERRRPQRFGGWRPCAFARHAGGGGDRHCPGSLECLRATAAQL